MSIDGDIITVKISNRSVDSSGDLDVQDIILSHDGSEDYEPVKKTRATISCVINEVTLLEFCRADDTRVTITRSDGVILFSGWAVPNVFSQPYTAINDVVGIECVDILGYSQYIQYSPESAPTLKVLRVSDICERILTIMDARAGNESIMFSDTIFFRGRWYGYDINNPEDEPLMTSRIDVKFPELTLPEMYFVKDGLSPDATKYPTNPKPDMMSCYDVLAMIAESVRMTWVQEGDILYLIDNLAIRDGKTNYYDPINGDSYILGGGHMIDEETFSSSEHKVSLAKRYTQFSLEHDKEEDIAIYQDVFDNATLAPLDNDVKRYVTNDPNLIVFAQKLKSTVYETTGDCSFVGYREHRYGGIERDAFNENWDKAIRLVDSGDGGGQELFRRKKAFGVDVPRAKNKDFRVNVKLVVNDNESSLWPAQGVKGEYTLYVTIRVGNKYYRNYGWFSDEKYYIPFKFDEDGKCYIPSMLPAGNPYGEYRREPVFSLDASPNSPHNEYQIEIAVCSCPNADENDWSVAYITEFEVVECADRDMQSYEDELSLPPVEYFGSYEFLKEYSVSLPIDNYYIMSPKSFGTMPGVDGVPNVILFGAEEQTMIERIAAMTNAGDGIMIDTTLRDDNLSLLNIYECAAWQDGKVMIAFERRLKDKTIKVTLL